VHLPEKYKFSSKVVVFPRNIASCSHLYLLWHRSFELHSVPLLLLLTLIATPISFTGTKTNYDLKFTGKEKDFVEFKDLPKLKEVTVAFWVKTIDKTKKGTIFSYSVPGKRNALSLADPNGLRLYVNGDEKDGVHK
jgi:hypothetical protein